MQGEEMRDANRGCGEPRRDLNRAAKWIWLLLLVLAASPCPAADLTIEQVRDKLAAATCEHPADFSGKSLDNLDWIMRANFTNADLSKASLFGPVVSSGVDVSAAEGPSFKGANFSGARIIARLSRLDLSGANFAGAMMGADMRNQSMGLMRTDLSGANLAGANFTKADLGRASLR